MTVTTVTPALPISNLTVDTDGSLWHSGEKLYGRRDINETIRILQRTRTLLRRGWYNGDGPAGDRHGDPVDAWDPRATRWDIPAAVDVASYAILTASQRPVDSTGSRHDHLACYGPRWLAYAMINEALGREYAPWVTTRMAIVLGVDWLDPRWVPDYPIERVAVCTVEVQGWSQRRALAVLGDAIRTAKTVRRIMAQATIGDQTAVDDTAGLTGIMDRLWVISPLARGGDDPAAIAERDDLIRRGREQRATFAELSAATGLSRQRLHQILTGDGAS